MLRYKASIRLANTKLGKVRSIVEGPPPIKSQDPLITWSHLVTGQIKKDISLLSSGSQPPNLTGWWLMTRGQYTKHYIALWVRGDVKCQRISRPRTPTATKLDRVEVCDERTTHRVKKNSMILWSRGHVSPCTWRMRTNISPHPQCPQPPNLTG